MQRKIIILLLMLLVFGGNMFAQSSDQQSQQERQIVRPEIPFFVPHWYVRAQGGLAYDVGEAKFSQLISPAIQLAVGYNFNEFLGVRGTVSGLWARNQYGYPEAKYNWNFIQPTVEAEVNLTNLFFGTDFKRLATLYAFGGVGAAFSFNNDDVNDAYKKFLQNYKYYNSPLVQMQPEYFEKRWNDSRWNPVVKFGLGLDFQITEQLSVGAEVNANLLPDHFNSKKGKSDNKDWHFNALFGLKFNIGRTHGYVEPVYEEPRQLERMNTPNQFVDVPIEKISFNVNIYFVINQSIIRQNQIPKLTALLKYLNEHPRAFIRLSGFADKDTGTPTINMRLSIERAQVVSQYLQDKGIEEWRIRRFAKGDKVQPFDIPEENRVCICYVYDPDNPVPQEFTY